MTWFDIAGISLALWIGILFYAILILIHLKKGRKNNG